MRRTCACSAHNFRAYPLTVPHSLAKMKENCESFYNAHIDCLENNNHVRRFNLCFQSHSDMTSGIPLLPRVRTAIEQVHVRQACERGFARHR